MTSQLNKQLGVQLPESEDYEFLAGLLLAQLKHIPRVGETVRLGPVQLTVIAATDHPRGGVPTAAADSPAIKVT